MTIKEAILISIEKLNKPVSAQEITEFIISNNLYEFQGKTPESTISARLGDFIRQGDNRLKRIKQSNGVFLYYLTKNEQTIISFEHEKLNHFSNSCENKAKNFDERDLHILLSSYLKNLDIYSKTIFHEQSNGKDRNQTWTHPDMVGVKFLHLQTNTCQNFLKSINRNETFKIYSYELKKEISTDSELKQSYFQAVSNSSWANYGYLVVLEFNDCLMDEMARLNHSFGIGIIQLNSNPFRSKVLFPANLRSLDFKTIDKLCKINHQFNEFIEKIEKLISASEKYISAIRQELKDFCDDYLEKDSDIELYCKQKNIPLENEQYY